jgi:hypothetical protein
MFFGAVARSGVFVVDDSIEKRMNDLLAKAKSFNLGTAPSGERTAFQTEMEILKDARQMELLTKHEKLIDELGRFADTVKTSGENTASLIKEILEENRKLRRYTLALAVATVVLAAATVWMAISTQQLANQEQAKHENRGS